MNCNFFAKSNIYVNIFDRIKSDILNGKFPQCFDTSLLCEKSYRGKLMLKANNICLIERFEIQDNDRIYLIVSEYIYKDINHNKSRIIHIRCDCKYNKVKCLYTISQIRGYFDNFNSVDVYYLGDASIQDFIKSL